MAIVSLEIIAGGKDEYLLLHPPQGSEFRSDPVVIAGEKYESADRLNVRGRETIRNSCPIGHAVCRAVVSSDKVSGHILSASVVCNYEICPLDDSGGSSSGDREPRLPISPVGETEAEESLPINE